MLEFSLWWLIAWCLTAGAVVLVTIVSTRGLIGYLEARAILDHPNARSSHDRPTPRGGGLAVTPVVVVAWAGLIATGAWSSPLTGEAAPWLMLAGLVALTGVSWMDDRHSLGAAPRLLLHLAAAAAPVAALPADVAILHPALPLLLDRAITVLAFAWFINLFNFMDGIDGITGAQMIAVGGGVALLVALGASSDGGLGLAAVALAAAGAGFLVWNWHPARIFLGDVGSVPLGFATGWLLIETAAGGQRIAALILPLYYLTDATLTLGLRALRGERIWQAHRQHFYQRAARGRLTHAGVVRRIAAANALLIALALIAGKHPWFAAGAAVVVVAGLLAVLLRNARTPPGHLPAVGGNRSVR
jgi:UDP-N-acetylmuramyl pentapeptide phosphotransferase/UDP-N-acetylglucosamine-1-phosphate transferase